MTAKADAQHRSAPVADELPLFTKTTDFLLWLTPQTNHFPRVHRQTFTRRLLDAALDFQEAILEANLWRDAARLERLRAADISLDKVRMYLRLILLLHWITMSQYEHASRQVAELGRLLGAWQKNTRQQSAA